MSNRSSIEDLLKEISSKSPAPGGGSVAALSGCFGAALVSMVCNLTIGKKKYIEVEDEMKVIKKEAESLRKELLNLSSKDVKAFNQVITAYKSNEDNKEILLQNAYKKAAEVPLDVAKDCLRVLELVEIIIKKGNKNTVSDAGVAALMASSGLNGAIFNVKVNLKSIKDDEFIKVKSERLKNLEKKRKKLFFEIMKIVDSYLSDF